MKQQLNRPDGFDYAAIFAGVAAVLFAGYLAAGCQPAKTAAEADYLARQLKCVDNATTKDEATACRNAVRAAWAAKDGGQ